jgi:hypothetical protein
MATDRLVVYSLALPDDDPRPDLIWQFDASVSTLRRHNADIAVALFVHGALPRALAEVCYANKVMVRDQGLYSPRLAALTPTGWPALSHYPLLHRFLNFSELSTLGARQMLVCDFDTIFFDDVGKLFERYGEADVVGREEVHSGRSAHGPDRSFIDEDLLRRLAIQEGVPLVPPFNLGVVLFNNGSWRHLAALADRFVDYAWRLVMGMVLWPSRPGSPFGEFKGLAQARAHASRRDIERALPYPSSNHWILDEVALWLTLGHVPGLRTADFSAADVAENGEFTNAAPGRGGWVMCHYYTQNMARITEWLRAQPV